MVPIPVTDDQRALADVLRSWAARRRPVGAARAMETEPDRWRSPWTDLVGLGVLAVATPESLGGGGGTVAELAVALEQCADALGPGPILSSVLAGLLLAEHPLGAALATGDRSAGVALGSGDLRVDEGQLLHGTARPVLGAAAEAAGVASWCLHTAVDYAKVREQFGQPIGGFQAIKHLCAEMLCRAEVAAAVAWDAAQIVDDPTQHPLAAAVAAALALDAAVENAKDCIQVLGGIGYTWEHDAHLYLRRALALRQFLGGSEPWRRRATELTAGGARRVLRVELGLEDQRAGVRRQAAAIAAAAEPTRRRLLADSGYLVPHWPSPHGLDAPPALQLLVDEELDRAGVVRPDLVIAGWAVPTILRQGSPEQVERFATPTLRGELVWCQLFSEPGAGSDLASLRMRAQRVDGGWQLTGQKVWTSAAHRADWGVCLARTDVDLPKHQGITYFLIDMKSPGIDIGPLREITGAALFNEVFFNEVFVPDDLVVGDVNGGWALARTTLSQERVAMGGGSSIGDAVKRLVRQCVADGQTDDPVVAGALGALISAGASASPVAPRRCCAAWPPSACSACPADRIDSPNPMDFEVGCRSRGAGRPGCARRFQPVLRPSDSSRAARRVRPGRTRMGRAPGSRRYAE